MMKTRRRIVGFHAVETALKHTPEQILNIWIDHRRADQRITAIERQLENLGMTAQPAGRQRLDILAEGQNHQGVVAELALPAELGEHELQNVLSKLPASPLFLVLDHVQDPHNFGACLRTADAAGVHGVILTKDQSVGITPTVTKVACGATETVPVYRVTNLARTLDWCKESGLWIVGAAGESSQSLYHTDLTLPLVIAIGAEEKGLRRLTRERCDWLVQIPRLGQVESLNLSVATGILLFEAVRQRLATGNS